MRPAEGGQRDVVRRVRRGGPPRAARTPPRPPHPRTHHGRGQQQTDYEGACEPAQHAATT